MGKTTFHVELIAVTEDAEAVVAKAAKTCYAGRDKLAGMLDGLGIEDIRGYIGKLFEMGHMSPFEHVSFTFAIEGVSRAFLAQLTRHRLASYSVRSQRYCSEGDFEYVIPQSIENLHTIRPQYKAMMDDIGRLYKRMVAMGIPKEDARMVLPNACATRLVVTMNARELLHFFALRCCSRAQWEIREVANKMLELCRGQAPGVFAKAGASCRQMGYCPEGSRTCGKVRTLGELLDGACKETATEEQTGQGQDHGESHDGAGQGGAESNACGGAEQKPH